MIKCQFCGSDNERWYVYCQNCGKKLAAEKEAGSPGEETADDLGSDFLLDRQFESSKPGKYSEMSLPDQSTLALEDLALPGVKEPAPTPKLTPAPMPSPVTGPQVRIPPSPIPGPVTGPQAKMPSPPIPGPVTGPQAKMPPSPAIETPPVPKLTCLRCGYEVPPNFAFCGYCGLRMGQREEAEVMKRDADKARPETEGRYQPGPPVAMLVRVREDGTFDSGFAIREGETVIGRENGDLTFPTDSLMSKRHARIVASKRKLQLEDLESTNGTFLRLRIKTLLRSGDYLLIGKQLLRYEKEGAETAAAGAASANQTMVLGSLVGKYEARLIKRLPSGRDSNEYPLTESSIVIGREKGDLIFKNDPYVSGRHVRIQEEAEGHSIEDLNSSNGTYLKLRQKEEIRADDFFIVGEQLFQVRLITN